MSSCSSISVITFAYFLPRVIMVYKSFQAASLIHLNGAGSLGASKATLPFKKKSNSLRLSSPSVS